MPIPEWLTKVAAEAKDSSVDFMDARYADLLNKLKEGKLDDTTASAVDEIEQLRGVINQAVSKLTGTMHKEAKTPLKTSPTDDDYSPEAMKLTPDEEKVNKLIADSPEVADKPKPGKLPAKIKQPETTKWKEIRFNKRTGTWQVVVTIRHTRNFLSENEAVDFTKKASMDLLAKENLPAPKGSYQIMDGATPVGEPFLDAVEATKKVAELSAKNPGKVYTIK